MSTIKHYEITPQGQELLKQIEDELPQIKLLKSDDHGNREYEPNAKLDAKVMPLLENLELSVREDAIIMSKQLLNIWQNLGYTVWRISNRITIHNETGPGYLIPVHISGSPCLTPGGPQKPGSYTYYSVDTELSPELDCIFLAQHRKGN
jgi:hypothetical protein